MTEEPRIHVVRWALVAAVATIGRVPGQRPQEFDGSGTGRPHPRLRPGSLKDGHQRFSCRAVPGRIDRCRDPAIGSAHGGFGPRARRPLPSPVSLRAGGRPWRAETGLESPPRYAPRRCLPGTIGPARPGRAGVPRVRAVPDRRLTRRRSPGAAQNGDDRARQAREACAPCAGTRRNRRRTGRSAALGDPATGMRGVSDDRPLPIKCIGERRRAAVRLRVGNSAAWHRAVSRRCWTDLPP